MGEAPWLEQTNTQLSLSQEDFASPFPPLKPYIMTYLLHLSKAINQNREDTARHGLLEYNHLMNLTSFPSNAFSLVQQGAAAYSFPSLPKGTQPGIKSTSTSMQS